MGGWLFAALLGWIGGTALQLRQAELWPLGVYGGAALSGLGLAAAAAWAARHRRASGGRPAKAPAGAPSGGRVALMALAAAAMLGWAQVGVRAVAFQGQALAPALEGVDLWLTGVVDDLPQIRDGDQRIRLNVEHVSLASPGGTHDADGASWPASSGPGRIALTWYAPRSWPGAGAGEAGRGNQPANPLVRAGERWRLPVRLRAPHGHFNPHGFDYELWLWERGIQAVGYVRSGRSLPAPERLAQTRHHLMDQWRQRVRERIEAQVARPPSFQAAGDASLAGILSALVVGDQAAIEAQDWAVFRSTGVAHLMAVSGLHITMFAWLAVRLVGAGWRRSVRLTRLCPAPVAALLCGVALATLYAAFSGWGIPAQRTIWMLLGVALLRLGGVQWPQPMTWLAAMAVVVAMDPWALLQAGFWLSFVAVGVLFASGPERSAQVHLSAAAALGAAPGGGVPGLARLGLRHVLASVREQWLLTLALAPLTLLLFQQVSVVGTLVNLLAIPYVSFIVLPLSMLGMVLPFLWNVAAWFLAGLMQALNWCAALPWAVWGMAARPDWAAALAVAAGIVLTLRWPWPWKALALPGLLPMALWQWDAPKQGEFELVAMDVGQGQAVLVRTATHALLYDAGPLYARRGEVSIDAGERVVVPYLQARGVRLDRVVFSHTDSDHIGGAEAVLGHAPAADWLGSVPAGHRLHAIRPGQPCVAGTQWTWDGVRFRVLHPPRADDAAMKRAPNAQSCVLLVGNGRAAALLPGDIGVREERQVLAFWREQGQAWGEVGVFMPHHGSRTSSSAALIAGIRPRWAVAQAGYRNRFGHPAPDVVARYERQGTPVFETARCGAWQWRSGQPADFECARQAQGRYWHHRP